MYNIHHYIPRYTPLYTPFTKNSGTLIANSFRLLVVYYLLLLAVLWFLVIGTHTITITVILYEDIVAM